MTATPFLTVSFSGAGHLLSYHLGVTSKIVEVSTTVPATKQNGLPRIRAVAGSSSGAIAATLLSRIPHRMEEFTNRFLDDGGRALSHLEWMLRDEEESTTTTMTTTSAPSPTLYVATTRCKDGYPKLFEFKKSADNTNRVLEAVRASCRIPQSFHPVDVIEWPSFARWKDSLAPKGLERPSSAPTYPDADGVCIDETWYVDGGIAAPVPPTPFDNDDDTIGLVVCPLSYTHEDRKGQHEGIYRISPADFTRRLLPFDLSVRGGLRIRPSIQNLHALQTSVGIVKKEELRHWYSLGVEDGERWVRDYTGT